MAEFLSKWLASEAFKHPLVFLAALIVMGGTGSMILNPFVSADEFGDYRESTEKRFISLERKVDTSVEDLRRDVQVQSVEQQLRAVESEMWNLQRLIDSGGATPRDESRLNALRSDKGSLERKLDRLCQGGGCRVGD